MWIKTYNINIFNNANIQISQNRNSQSTMLSLSKSKSKSKRLQKPKIFEIHICEVGNRVSWLNQISFRTWNETVKARGSETYPWRYRIRSHNRSVHKSHISEIFNLCATLCIGDMSFFIFPIAYNPMKIRNEFFLDQIAKK